MRTIVSSSTNSTKQYRSDHGFGACDKQRHHWRANEAAEFCWNYCLFDGWAQAGQTNS